MKKYLSILIVLFVTLPISGCIISATPKNSPIVMLPGVLMTFSVDTLFPVVKSYKENKGVRPLFLIICFVLQT
jgi:hypothetical protein